MRNIFSGVKFRIHISGKISHSDKQHAGKSHRQNRHHSSLFIIGKPCHCQPSDIDIFSARPAAVFLLRSPLISHSFHRRNFRYDAHRSLQGQPDRKSGNRSYQHRGNRRKKRNILCAVSHGRRHRLLYQPVKRQGRYEKSCDNAGGNSGKSEKHSLPEHNFFHLSARSPYRADLSVFLHTVGDTGLENIIDYHDGENDHHQRDQHTSRDRFGSGVFGPDEISAVGTGITLVYAALSSQIFYDLISVVTIDPGGVR